MAKVYYELISKDLWSIERVPTRWQAEVQALRDAGKADKE